MGRKLQHFPYRPKPDSAERLRRTLSGLNTVWELRGFLEHTRRTAPDVAARIEVWTKTADGGKVPVEWWENQPVPEGGAVISLVLNAQKGLN